MQLALSNPLPQVVRAKFDAAKAVGDLVFSATELSVIRTKSGVPFQLRFCPALAKKPTSLISASRARPQDRPDPFDNPDPGLLIGNMPTQDPSHVLVLNKFPVIPLHFIVATQLNKPQANLLDIEDLDATYACLKAWQNAGGGSLFAFFNSGEYSGASQPHRHLQFLPVEQMYQGQDIGGWQVLLDLLGDEEDATELDPEQPAIRSYNSLPFALYFARLSSDASPATLFSLYKKLHAKATTAVQAFIRQHPDELLLHESSGGASAISYNLALTSSKIAICPRRRGGAVLQTRDGVALGPIELNGTVLGGTLMVKTEVEWEALKADANLLDSLLASIGIPQEYTE